MSTPPFSTVRILVSACGTGGHYYPALAVARCLLDAGAGVRILVDRAGGGAAAREFLGADAPALELPSERAGRWRWGWAAARRYQATSRLLASCGCHAFLSMGGGGSLPPLLAALRHGVPVAVHEANAYPGRANRWCARRVAIAAFAMRGEHPFYQLPNAVEVGMPLRSYPAASGASATFPTSSFAPPGDRRPRVLVMGGSQGAHALNERLIETLQGRPELARSLRLAHVTGDADRDTVADAYARSAIEVDVRAAVSDLPRWLDRFDYAISRAGSSAVWELVRAGVPALLVPYPYAADDHQMANARWAAGIGPYEPLRQDRLTADLIADRLAAVAGRSLGRGAPGAGTIAPRTAERSRAAAGQMASLLLDLATRRIAGQAASETGGAVSWNGSALSTLTHAASEQ